MKEERMLELFNAWYPPPGIPISREAALAAYQKGQRDLIEAMEQVGVIYHEYVYLNRSMEGMTKTTRKNVMKKSVPVYRLPEDTTK